MSSIEIEEIILTVPAGNSVDVRADEIDIRAITVSDLTITDEINGQPVVGQFVFTGSTQVLTNKSLVDTSTYVVDSVDNTKRIQFDAANTTGTTALIQVINTANRSYILRDAPSTATILLSEGTNQVNGASNFAGGISVGTILEYTASAGVTIDEIRLRTDTALTTVASITSLSAATNCNIALIPKGLGGVCLAVPDGLAAGGNARGQYAIDLQLVRATAAQVASGDNAALLSGSNGTASGANSAIMGGDGNTASSARSSIMGGLNNLASNINSSVVGGTTNTASGAGGAVMGGASNTASGTDGVIVGGSTNIANNTNCAVLGGTGNTSSALNAGIVGGTGNLASNTNSIVLGGSGNVSGGVNSISGGATCAANGANSVALGLNCIATGLHSVAIGNAATSANDGSMVLSSTTTSSDLDNQLLLAFDFMDINVSESIAYGRQTKLYSGHIADTAGASVVTLYTIPTDADTAYTLSMRVVVTSDGGGDVGFYRIVYVAINNGGILSLSATADLFTHDSGAGTAGASINMSISGTDILARVSGFGVAALHWSGIVETQEISTV